MHVELSEKEQADQVLRAAVRAAADIRRDAEIWAQQHMEEARRRAEGLEARRSDELSAIIDELLARTKAVATASEELVETLDQEGRQNGASPR